MKKIGDIDFGALNNAVYLFSKISYSLRDIGKIIFLSGVTPLSPTSWFVCIAALTRKSHRK
jgi:hypothetical protein